LEKSNSYIGILVTGSSGQLGKTISELYKDQNNLRFHFKSKSELDITQLSDLEKFFQHHQIDFIINCAAYTNVEDAEVRRVKAQKVNSSGVLNLVNVSRKHNTKLIHISTDYVFDGIKKTPYTENDIPNPLNYYGITKLMGESIIKDADVDYYIIRTSWLYSKFENNFFTFITNALTQNKEIQITTSQKGVPTSVKSFI
jgi:dTDP-4-dehydrorhamnose reductase